MLFEKTKFCNMMSIFLTCQKIDWSNCIRQLLGINDTSDHTTQSAPKFWKRFTFPGKRSDLKVLTFLFFFIFKFWILALYIRRVVARSIAEKGIWWVVMECNMCNMCNIADSDSKKNDTPSNACNTCNMCNITMISWMVWCM